MDTETAYVVKVDYVGVIHHVLENTQEKYSLPPGSTVKALLHMLVERHGKEVADCILSSNGQLNSMVKVFLNNDDISRLQGLDTPITGESQVFILVGLIPVQGG